MKRNIYLMVMLLCLTAFKGIASRQISGTVFADNDKRPLPGVSVKIEGESRGVVTDANGRYRIVVPDKSTVLLFAHIGYKRQRVQVKQSNTVNVYLQLDSVPLNEIIIVGYGAQRKRDLTGALVAVQSISAPPALSGRHDWINISSDSQESYKKITENGFLKPQSAPLSTFAIDVDGASYSNFRRFIHGGTLPPENAVRIEEMINYFKYDLKGPENNEPVAIHNELSTAPWNAKHQLLRIALKAKEIESKKLPSSNLVFLIDVSGSMQSENKLPLVKASLKLLVDQLREKDKVAIVTYAGDVGVKLPATSGSEKLKIKNVIDALGAGGGTAGGAGIKMAYQVAREHFLKEGNNRIILATDGDFNVGLSSDEDLESLVAREQESGISISVLGFGMGNYKDSKMETIANKGHGNYAYIDNINEARKSMVTEFGGTLFTVAKDVKVQVEFNPAKVQAYRLLGYENRLLEKEDFNNDKKQGGDMGVGHVVTALYEIIPEGVKSDFSGNVDPLKYQKEESLKPAGGSSEIATIKFRYKETESSKSKLQQRVVPGTTIPFNAASEDFRFATAVAELGMLLRNSTFKQESDFDKLILRAKEAKGKDEEGYRAEFIRLAESVKLLAENVKLARQGEE